MEYIRTIVRYDPINYSNRILIQQWGSGSGGWWTYPIKFNSAILGGSRLFYNNDAKGSHDALSVKDGIYHFAVEDIGIRQPTLSNAYLNNFVSLPSFYHILIGY